jgi:hypothetical protein
MDRAGKHLGPAALGTFDDDDSLQHGWLIQPTTDRDINAIDAPSCKFLLPIPCRTDKQDNRASRESEKDARIRQRLGDERQEANMDPEIFVMVISLAVIGLITAGVVERRGSAGTDHLES